MKFQENYIKREIKKKLGLTLISPKLNRQFATVGTILNILFDGNIFEYAATPVGGRLV